MRIAIPSNGDKGLEERVAYHFGRCPYYTILDEKGKVVEIKENTSEHMGGSGLPPKILKEQGINILLCRGLGRKAIAFSDRIGLEVQIGERQTVKEIFEEWKAGNTKKATMADSCK